MTKATENNNLADLSNEQQAEQQLMHALLKQTYQSESLAHKDQQVRINKVLAAITEDKETCQTTTASSNSRGENLLFSFSIKSWIGLAASICLLAVTLSLVILPSNRAIAEVNAMLERMTELGDRRYHVSVSPISGTEDLANKTSAAQWLDGANLFIRGADQYVLEAETSKGKVIRGRNQNASWKIDHKNRIKYYQDQNKIKLPFAGDAVSMAFMDLPELLVTLTEKYQLTYQPDVQYAEQSQHTLSLLIANKKSAQKGAVQVYVYYQADTFQIERIVFNRVHMQGSNERYQIGLNLINSDPLASEFFQANYHLSASY